MIYLDNAATTFPKPKAVTAAWQNALSAFGANPGRSSHAFSEKTARAVFRSREICAGFFGAKTENTVFTLNCTQALNFVIKGLARRGCRFVISDIEHNAVVRPVYAACRENGGHCAVYETFPEEEKTLESARRALKDGASALICAAAGNVTGGRNPVKALGELCRERGVPFVTDAAQGAGVFDIKMSDADFICAAGHKGLYGPMGTGLLLTNGAYELKTLVEGGTGSLSESFLQPDFTPDRFESGTINTAGVIALGAGVDFVKKRGINSIFSHEISLCESFCAGLKKIPSAILYNDINPRTRKSYAPVVSFNIMGKTSFETAQLLSQRGIYMRAGLHCAPFAHKKLGTSDVGTVRFAPSVFNTQSDVNALLREIGRLK